MEHGITRRRPRTARRPSATPRAPLGRRLVAAAGLALCVGVGVAAVTTTLAEAAPASAPTSAPMPAPTSAPTSVTPAARAAPSGPNPLVLRLWGLRMTPQGTLVPVSPGDPAARTAIEVHADLLAPPRR